MPLRIAICCCNYLYGEGIKALIEKSDLDTGDVANCSHPEELVHLKPDLLVTDYSALSSLPLNSLSEHKVGILLIGTGCLPGIDDERLLEFISKGLTGILSLKSDSTQFKTAIQKVSSGELWLNHKKVRVILSRIKDLKKEDIASFTKKEIEIIRMICKGYRNKEIAQSLNLSEQSVKLHLHRIYEKVGITDRLQLAIYAFKNLPDHLN